MRSLVPAAVLAASALAAGCDTTPGPSLYDPIAKGVYTPAPDPVITSVTADAGSPMIGPSFVAGLTSITITGSNFKPHTDSTFVYVAGQRVMPTSITPTQIRLRVPNLPGESQTVRISVLGATNFGRPTPFSIKSAFTRWGDIGAANALYGVAADVATQSGFVSMSETSASQGIVRVTGAAKGTSVITTTFFWPELSFYDAQIYGVRGVQAVFRFAVPSGSTPTTQQQVWHNLTDARISLRAIDVDPEGTVWTGGINTNPDVTQRGFYRITQAKVVTRTPFDGEVTAIEKAGSKLYVAGIRGVTRGIWRYDVAADGTVSGEAQLVAFAGTYAGITANALAVTTAGDVIVGTDFAAEPVLRVTPSGEISSLYPGLLSGTATAMRWISPTQLLISGPRVLADANSVKTLGDLIVAEAFTTGQL